MVWTFVFVEWDNPAWKPKAAVLRVPQRKTWELVGRLYHPQGQTTLNHKTRCFIKCFIIAILSIML